MSWKRLSDWLFQLRSSLKARVALGVALPVLIAMISLSLFHYWREYRLIEDQARVSAVRLGDMMIHSLNHAMLIKDGTHLIATLGDVGNLENVEKIQVVGLSGQVLADSDGNYATSILDISSPECQACHVFPPASRPRVIQFEPDSPDLRISVPRASPGAPASAVPRGIPLRRAGRRRRPRRRRTGHFRSDDLPRPQCKHDLG